MKVAPLPENERERLAALAETKLLDTAPEQDFDDLAKIAAEVCGVPIALVSLVDKDRQWFKAKVGLDAPETPRDVAFCSHAILMHEAMVIEDAHTDARFVDNPLVTGAPHVRFYAGTPLITDEGHALGTLCVIDHVAKKLSKTQLDTLDALGRQVVRQIRLRRLARQSEDAKDRLSDILDHTTDLVQSVAPDGRYLYVNHAWEKTLGYTSSDLERVTMFDVIAPDHQEACQTAFSRLLEGKDERVAVLTVFIAKDGRRLNVEGTASCRFEQGKPMATRAIFRDVTEATRSRVELAGR